MYNSPFKTQLATILCGLLVGEGARSIFGYIEFDILNVQDHFNYELALDCLGGVLLGIGLYVICNNVIMEDLKRSFLFTAWMAYSITAIVVAVQHPGIPNEYRHLFASFVVSSVSLSIGYVFPSLKINDRSNR
jgi:hypothetical protein